MLMIRMTPQSRITEQQNLCECVRLCIRRVVLLFIQNRAMGNVLILPTWWTLNLHNLGYNRAH